MAVRAVHFLPQSFITHFWNGFGRRLLDEPTGSFPFRFEACRLFAHSPQYACHSLLMSP